MLKPLALVLKRSTWYLIGIDKKVILSLEFDADFQAIEFVMGYGKDVLVLEPTELIDHILERAHAIPQVYK